ncbi:MAG: T9SS type A sorting domain-containing protein, partial [Pedobacter sp.]|nr:T9SS type A sorting domain-containing protein [Chitinophagaceae bacterium]
LLQKDRDGKTNYSPTISITNATKPFSLLSIYPNPVDDKLNALVNVVVSNQIATISIQDLTGKIVSKFEKQLTVGQSNIEIDVSKQAASTYLLVIELPSGDKLVQKFIKK